MAIDLRIAGWEASGLRCPDHSISLLANETSCYPVSLIQMPNGTGKTTTLNLLRAALGGEPIKEPWDAEKVRSFRKTEAWRHLPEHQDSEGRFQVRLLYNGARLTFTLNFDFEDGRVDFSTTLQSGMKRGFHPPRELERFLKLDFVHFFVFDGELANLLIDSSHTDAETAIDDLFQLKNFNLISTRVREYWEHEVQGRTALGEKGVRQRTNTVKKLRERIAELERIREQKEKEFAGSTKRLKEIESEFDEGLKAQATQQESLRQANQDLALARRGIDEQTAKIVLALKSPCSVSHIFALELLDFKQGLDRAKLPESAAKEFFSELAEEDLCVCGRPLDSESRRALVERAQAYLGSEDVALLNAIKGQISDHVGDEPGAPEHAMQTQIDRLHEYSREAVQLRTLRDRIESDAAGGDPTLQRVADEIRELRDNISSLKRALQSFDDPTDSLRDENTVGITILKRRLTDAEKMLAEVTNTLELRKKRDIVLKVLEAAYSESRAALSKEITAEANKRIDNLMPDNRIRIARIDGSLKLEGQEAGSTGENLSVAYAFLSTLFSGSEHSLPFIVDSPANPIDLKVRRQVAPLIPQLCDQFVAFTISTERAGFLDPLEEVAGYINYLTMFRKGNAEYEERASAQAEVVKTGDGVLVEGRDFFRSFHLETQD